MDKLITFYSKKVQCLDASLSFFSSIKQKCILGSLGNSSVCCYASRSTHHCRSGLLSAGNTIQRNPGDLFSYAMDLNNPMPFQQAWYKCPGLSAREHPKGEFKAFSSSKLQACIVDIIKSKCRSRVCFCSRSKAILNVFWWLTFICIYLKYYQRIFHGTCTFIYRYNPKCI